jgi:glycosyltransferase involved in cell wall biosynthesis
MKILIVNTRHYPGGGDSTYTFNLANLLRSKKHEVAFFAMQSEHNLPDPNADLFVSHIDFRELNRSKNPINGLRVLGRSIYSCEARIKFARLLERFQPDIVHLQNIHAHITPSVILEAKKSGIPMVWTLHDYKLVCPNSHFLIDTTGQVCEDCGQGRYYHAVIKQCKKGSIMASTMASLEAYAHYLLHIREQVDIFLAPSQFLRNKFIQHGFPEKKIVHLPLFLSEEILENHTEGNQGYFLFLGKLDLIKGITILVEAARLSPEIQIVMAGQAEYGYLQSMQPIPSNIKYVGLKHGDELKALLTNAVALILPSICYENQPFSILEAFAYGKPVIASNLGGISELVTNGERGLLVPPGNATELSAALRWMLLYPKQIIEFGKNAYKYVSLYHSQDYHYEILNQIYTRLYK